MQNTIIHFLRILAAAVVGAIVTAVFSTVFTFLAANPLAFGSVTTIIGAILHLVDDEWLSAAPAVESTIQGQ